MLQRMLKNDDISLKMEETSVDEKLYFEVLNNIKSELTTAQSKVITTANEHMIIAYYNIGQRLVEKDTWGTKFLKLLVQDLKISLPQVKGLSYTNLRYMKRFALAYTESEFCQQPVGKLAWRSNIMLLDKLKTNEERFWYANKALENNWSSVVLDHQIGTRLIDKQSEKTQKITNYMVQHEEGFNERVQEMFKDPYLFDFVTYQEGIIEKKVEDELVTNITKLLMELGKGFAFVGRQYHLCVDNTDFYIDLLFYNFELRCFVVIELKTIEFQPEHAGKLGFYLSAVDSILKKPEDNPTVGILLTRGKSNLIAEFILNQTNAPIGVADYKFMEEIPKYLSEAMPSIEEIEKRLKEQKEFD